MTTQNAGSPTEAGASRYPRVGVRPWVWRMPGEPDRPGLGLFRGARFLLHLTHDQARTLADQLHDHADDFEQPLIQDRRSNDQEK